MKGDTKAGRKATDIVDCSLVRDSNLLMALDECKIDLQ